MQNITCPRCESATWKFGKARDPAGNAHQKYRCKTCKHQFSPTLPKRQKLAPNVPCPRCGSKMFVYKYLSDSLRLRCCRWREQSAKCAFKVNIPLPGQGPWKIISDPIHCLSVPVPQFQFKRFKYSRSTVALALYFSIASGLPAKTVAQIIKDIFGVPVSHDAITRWSKKAALALHNNLSPITLPSSSDWSIDETVVYRNGVKAWLWLVKDRAFRLIHAWYFSRRRATQHARNTFSIALHRTISLPRRLITDGLWSYASAKRDLSAMHSTEHWVCKELSASVNNNLVERQFGTFKDLMRRFRGFKSDLGLWSFITNQIYYHNFFKPHAVLKGKTPAQAAGAPIIYLKGPIWRTMMRFIF